MGAGERKSKVITLTPTISTGAYAVGDQLGDLQELSSAMDDSSGTGELLSISVHDKQAQSMALDVLLFNDLPTVSSTDNVSLDISDSEMASKCLGSVRVAAADYITLAASSMATVKNIKLQLNAVKSANNTTGRSLWAILRSAGTSTFGSTSDLVVKIGILQD